MTTADPAAATTAAKTDTAYVVLAKQKDALGATDASKVWAKVAIVNARTPEAAARAHAVKTGEGGSFVVIPERNWNEVTLAKKTVTTFEVAS